MKESKPLSHRFWMRVPMLSLSVCWPCRGYKDKDGYGRISEGSRSKWLKAHRISWELFCGPIPLGLQVLHECDNRPCVNPKHLYLGTPAENMADKVARGNQPRGEAVWNAKLTPEKVRRVRYLLSLGMPQTAIAKTVGGMHQSQVAKIKSGKIWGSVGA